MLIAICMRFHPRFDSICSAMDFPKFKPFWKVAARFEVAVKTLMQLSAINLDGPVAEN